LLGLVVAVGLLLVGSGVALGQPGPGVFQNHFRCYIVSSQTPQPAEAVTLEDQFNVDTPVSTLVGEPVMICPATEKTVGEVTFPFEEEQHYALYPAPGPAIPRNILVTDQFNPDGALWQVTTPKYLMVPTAKLTVNGEPTGLEDVREEMNHYWCYEATGPRVGARVTLEDQFDVNGPDNVRVTTPTLFCNPVEKVHNGVTFEVLDEETHLACYEIHGKQKTQQFTVGVANQFEEDEWQTGPWEILCAPAQKTLPTP
jgi:hypothetical protein